MIDLLNEILSWGGYLQRGPVQLQLLAVLAVLLAGGRLRRLWRHRRWPAWLEPVVLLAMLALVLPLLGLAGQPLGLVLTAWLFLAGWHGLGLLRRALRPLLPARELQQLDTNLIRPVYLAAALLVMVEQFGSLRDLGLLSLGRWFGAEVTVGQLLVALAITYLLVMGSRLPAEGLALVLQRGLGISDGSRRALALLLRYLAVGVGVIWALDHLGFDRTAILAVAGGLSVGLGFGIKEVFSNFVSGLWLLFEGSVRPGEVLFVEGDPCEVVQLGPRATTLWRDRDNAELLIPNQLFFTSSTTTYTGSDRLRRSEVRVSAAYRHDPRQVIALLEATAAACPRVLATPPPRGLLLSYGESGLNYGLRFWIANPMDNVSICSEVQTAVWHAFRDRGLEVPYPHQVQVPFPPAGGRSDRSAGVASPLAAPPPDDPAPDQQRL
ncbi:MAG: mechanosensitive ion channel domain-containing protein [Cyanobacteriota bacterium]|nr:mechanosensitive ion channel domain-containing protein [Cyanobacteriota bacterium]